MHDDLLALYAELQAMADNLNRQRQSMERVLIRLSTLLPSSPNPSTAIGPRPEGGQPQSTDPERAPVFRQGEKTLLRADLLRAVKADLERAVHLGLLVDPRMVDEIDTQTNASLYGAGVELRHRLRAHEALVGSLGAGEEAPTLDVQAETAPLMNAQARGV